MSPSHLFFIGGSGRSGTTILKKILAQHPQVAAIEGELRLAVDPDGMIDFYTALIHGWSPYLYDVKLKRLEKLLKDVGKGNRIGRLFLQFLTQFRLIKKIPFTLIPRYSEVCLTKYCPRYFEFVEELIQALVSFRYRARWCGSQFLEPSEMNYKAPSSPVELTRILGSFLRQVIHCILEQQDARFFVEDTPGNILSFDKLLELLPDAKLVHIYRDPRDVVASLTEQRWAPANPLQAAEWLRGVWERWREVRNVLPPDSFKEISLEDLAAEPERILMALCGFLGIGWNRALLEVDLSRAHSGRWKADLTQEEQIRITSVLASPLKEMGHEKESYVNP